MANVGDITVSIGASIAPFKNAMAQVSHSLSKIGKDVSAATSGVGKSFSGMEEGAGSLGASLGELGITAGAAFAAVGAAVVVGLGLATAKAADFEAAMARVGAIAGASKADLQKLSNAALDLSAKMGYSSTEVAKAMEDLAAKGMTTNQIISAMPGILSAAAASGEDLANVSDVITSALNSFGLQAKDSSKVADVLAQAANDSAASIDDLGYTFKYAAPTAHSLGISMEELAASTEIMSNAGIKGETAGTTLRQALIRLSGAVPTATKALNKLGVSTKDSKGDFLPFSNIVGQLSSKLKDETNAQRVAALSHIFGAEAVSGMLTVIDAGPAKLNKLTQSLVNSGGASAKTADVMRNNLNGSLDKLKGAFEALTIKIGTVFLPAAKQVVDFATKLVQAFNQLPAAMQKSSTMTTIWNGIKTSFQAVVDYLRPAAQAIATFVNQQFAKIKAWWDTNGPEVMQAARNVFKGIKLIFDTTIKPLAPLFKAVWDAVVIAIQTAWKIIKTVVSTGISVITKGITLVADMLTGKWGKAWKDAKSLAKTALDGIGKLAKDILGGLGKSAFSWAENLGDMFSKGLGKKIGAIEDQAKAAAEAVWKYLGHGSPTKEGPGSKSDKWAPNLMNMFAGGIKASIPKLQMAVNSAALVTAHLQSTPNNNHTMNNNVTINAQQANFTPRQLVRELDRMRWLGGGGAR